MMGVVGQARKHPSRNKKLKNQHQTAHQQGTVGHASTDRFQINRCRSLVFIPLTNFVAEYFRKKLTRNG